MLTGARPLVAEGKGKAVEVAAKIVGTSKTLVQDALLLSKKSTAVHRDAEPDTPGTRPARRAPGPRTNAQGLRETGAGAAPGASWCVLSRCVRQAVARNSDCLSDVAVADGDVCAFDADRGRDSPTRQVQCDAGEDFDATEKAEGHGSIVARAAVRAGC
jgi:hypothetical protein